MPDLDVVESRYMNESPEGGKLSRRDFLKGASAVGATAAMEGVNMGNAEARNFTPEERESLQNEMRDFLNKTASYFERYTNGTHQSDLQKDIAQDLRRFNEAIRGGSSDYLKTEMEMALSKTRTDYFVRVGTAGLLDMTEMHLRLAFGAFLWVATEGNADLRREHQEAVNGLAEMREKFEVTRNF